MCTSKFFLHEKQILTLKKNWRRRLGRRNPLTAISGNGLVSFSFFTITAEIHARSLANFYCQYVDRHMNIKFMRQRARASNSTICYRKKQIDVSF